MKYLILLLSLITITISTANANTSPAPANAASVKHENPNNNIIASLSKEKQELYKKAIAENKAKIEPINNKIKEIRKEMRSLLSVSSFDKSAYLKKAEELRKLDVQKETIKYEAIAELAPQFSTNERKILINAFNDRSGKKYHSPKKQ